MSDKLKVRIQFTDGTTAEIEIGKLKPTGALLTEIKKQTGKNVYALTKNGVGISRGMVKNIVKNGNILKEVASPAPPPEDPRAIYKNEFLFEKIVSGEVPRSEVLNLKIKLLHVHKGAPVDAWIRRGTTLDELKIILRKIHGRTIHELQKVGEGHLLGWDKTMRIYTGNTPVELENGSVLEELREKDYEAKQKEMRRLAEMAEYRRYEERAREEEEAARQERARQEEERARAAPPVSKEGICEQFLGTNGITNRETYLKWALANHPDKFPDASPEEKERITEKFQIVNACVDLLKIKNIRGGRKTRKGKKHSRRRHSRKN